MTRTKILSPTWLYFQPYQYLRYPKIPASSVKLCFTYSFILNSPFLFKLALIFTKKPLLYFWRLKISLGHPLSVVVVVNRQFPTTSRNPTRIPNLHSHSGAWSLKIMTSESSDPRSFSIQSQPMNAEWGGGGVLIPYSYLRARSPCHTFRRSLGVSDWCRGGRGLGEPDLRSSDHLG